MATLICLKRVLIGKVKRNVAHNIVPSLHALATLGCVTKDHLYFFLLRHPRWSKASKFSIEQIREKVSLRSGQILRLC